MQQNGQRRRVRSQNHNLADAAVQRLGGFVGAFFQLAVVRGLLDEVENLLREGLVGDGPGGAFVGCHFFLNVRREVCWWYGVVV